jgi:hypothetical protein
MARKVNVSVDEFVATAKQEIIMECVGERPGMKVIPWRTLTSFEQLHDYRDANEFGGFCDDSIADALIEHFGGRDANEGMPDAMLDFMNQVQSALDVWIRTGGLRREVNLWYDAREQ